MKPLWPSHWTPPSRSGAAIDIISLVARELGTTPVMLKSACRKPKFIHGRAIVSNALYQRGVCLSVIGRLLGDRDHSTVGHSIKMLPVYKQQFPDLVPLSDRALLAARPVE